MITAFYKRFMYVLAYLFTTSPSLHVGVCTWTTRRSIDYSVPAFKHLSAEILSEIADALEEVRFTLIFQ